LTLFRKIFSALLCFLLSAGALYAAPRGKQELVPAGSWVYDALTAIALEEGRADFSDNAPLSINEILLYLGGQRMGSRNAPIRQKRTTVR